MARPKSKAEQTRISVRLPVEHVRVLKRRANEEDRTVSAEIRRLVRCYVTEIQEAAHGES